MLNCKHFGLVDPCENLLFEGYEADYSGVYTLHVRYLNSEVEIDATQVAGSELSFPITALNENYTYTGYVTDPEGERVRFSGNDVVKFTTAKTHKYGV